MGYNLPLYNNLKMKQMALDRLDALGYKWASGHKLNLIDFLFDTALYASIQIYVDTKQVMYCSYSNDNDWIHFRDREVQEDIDFNMLMSDAAKEIL